MDKKSVKTRIYISGAITNCPSFKENFAIAEKMLRKEGYEVVNLTKADTIMPKSASWDEYMALSYTLLNHLFSAPQHL